MDCINLYGLAFTVALLIPNVVFALKSGGGGRPLWSNKVVEALEQAWRFGCIAFMVFIVPGAKFGFASDEAFAAYLVADALLLAAYYAAWIFGKKRGAFSMGKALALSVIPALLFLASAVLSRYLPLLLAAALFAPCHVFISCKNAAAAKKAEKAEAER